jgi:hypothetical protein
MAITRALMKRQMYNMGGPALEAGAPDLRLTGDQRHRGIMSTAPQTYTQRRRAQMAGGGIMGSNNGSMLVAPTADGSRPGYAWYDDPLGTLKKVGQTIIPGGEQGYFDLYGNAGDVARNLSSSVGQNEPIDIEDWRIPEITITKPIPRPSENVGTGTGTGNPFGWIYGLGKGAGDVLTKVGQTIIPGGETGYGDIYGATGDVIKKVGQTIIPGGETGYGDIYAALGNIFGTPARAGEKTPDLRTPPIFGEDQDDEWTDVLKKESELSPWRKALATILPFGDPGYVEGGLYNALFGGLGGLGNTVLGGLGKAFDPENAGKYTIPLAAGLAAGKYQSDWLKKQPKFPEDQTSINFQTAAEAMADPNLRFKPKLEDTQLAADGGRIGYALGKGVTPSKPKEDIFIAWSNYKSMGGSKDFVGWYNDIYALDQGLEMPRAYAAEEDPWAKGAPYGYAKASDIGTMGESVTIPRTKEEPLDIEDWKYYAQGGRIGYFAGGPLVKKGITEALKKFKRPIFSYDDEVKMIMDLTETKKYTQDELMALDGDQLFEIYVREGFTPPKAIPQADETINLKNITPKIEKAQGGRIGFANGSEGVNQMYMSDEAGVIPKKGNQGITKEDVGLKRKDFDADKNYERYLRQQNKKAQSGRIGYDMGGGVEGMDIPLKYKPDEPLMDEQGNVSLRQIEILIKKGANNELIQRMTGTPVPIIERIRAKIGMASGGRIGAQEGGLMDLGGMEKDYRQEGGFVPIGGEEKADDVPARLSKNEFVFTADAVRSAGGGDIDQGAAVMERLMDNLEAGGKVSEESQGLEGAREMFATTQRLEKRII